MEYRDDPRTAESPRGAAARNLGPLPREGFDRDDGFDQYDARPSPEWLRAQRAAAVRSRQQMESRLRKAMFGGLALGGLLVVFRLVSALVGGSPSAAPSAAPTPDVRQTPAVASADSSTPQATPAGQMTPAAGQATPQTQGQGQPVAQMTPGPQTILGAPATGTVSARVGTEATVPRSGALATPAGNGAPNATAAGSGPAPSSTGASAAPASGSATSTALASLSGTGTQGRTAAGTPAAVSGRSTPGPGGASPAATSTGSSTSLSGTGTQSGTSGQAVSGPQGTGGAAPTAVTTGSSGPTTTGAAPAASTDSGRTYTVKSGDTLYAIARRYNTSVDALVKTNNLPAPDSILSIGQKLVLP